MSPRVHVHSGEQGIAQLLDRNRAWAEKMLARDPDFFTRLAIQQSPEILWIGCSDSRVPANEILDLSPGEVFVHRNIANQVNMTDTSTKADLLTEENVARSVYNVCHSRIVQNAWENGHTLSVHGLCYRLQDGIIRDLQICISGEDQVEAIYRRMMTKSTPEV
ncbi:hypothetical protein DYB25_000525 [Aphanomyces astaci]|uniref:Carbonic anhydrase n=1 Tax=Aphanomyces astaci TaxID=112090 RepID=A0A397BTY2_APHAT|nr:hypothetical protein DYB25_000525 [Aphanomyces astaci]RHY60003.1 hypothetical protein DYB38_001150 [Aphanomyces astaci]RHY70314.1 hypothetical protein DYB30_003635 [Aphanomyces astaci]RHY88654.1 hypothetical protein DYB35_007631 [Aphanomyces astaci]